MDNFMAFSVYPGSQLFFKEVVGPRQFLFAGLDSTMNAFRLLERRANFSFKFTPISRYTYT